MDILTKDRGSGGCSSNNSTDTLQNITAPYSNASNDILNQAKDQASSQKVVDHVGADFLVGNNVW